MHSTRAAAAHCRLLLSQDVKALVASCLANVLRLHVMECPYNATQQKARS